MTEVIRQNLGKVIDGSGFEHTMALSLNPKTAYHDGLIRCITRRTGDVRVVGYLDRSDLYKVSGESLEHFGIGEKLHIGQQEAVIQPLHKEGLDFLGLEDPDILVDEETGTTHVYFTIPIQDADRGIYTIYLGHAEGESLDSLQMTVPVLSPTEEVPWGAKELSVAPVSKDGVRRNLVESAEIHDGVYVSVIRSVNAQQLGKDWTFGEVVFHPKKNDYGWCDGHGSPGPLFPRSFIDVGEGKLLGILNGREAEKKVGNKLLFGMFSPGLMIYNYETGKIEWVSETPLVRDTEARTITFASQFIQMAPNVGVLYAHVDDSFVRAYTLYSNALKALIP